MQSLPFPTCGDYACEKHPEMALPCSRPTEVTEPPWIATAITSKAYFNILGYKIHHILMPKSFYRNSFCIVVLLSQVPQVRQSEGWARQLDNSSGWMEPTLLPLTFHWPQRVTRSYQNARKAGKSGPWWGSHLSETSPHSGRHLRIFQCPWAISAIADI